jgi:hypothetical protein
MANPSVEGPSGAGTERLRRAYLTSNTGWNIIIGGEADHLYTILSLTYSQATASAFNIGLRVDITGADSTHIQILDGHTSLPSYGTFVFSDKLVMAGTDHLEAYSASACQMYVSYIDQHF